MSQSDGEGGNDKTPDAAPVPPAPDTRPQMSEPEPEPLSDLRAEPPIHEDFRPENRFWYVRWLAYGFGGLAICVVGAAIVAAIYIARVGADLPDYSVLQKYQPPITTRVHAGDGSLLAEFATENRLFVPIEEIPPLVRNAFVAAEDSNFYKHGGVDLRGIMRAAIANIGNFINHRRPEGGSTITQQVAKNFLLNSDQKLERKVKEALIARRIESSFSKDKILELYLNQIYLGMSAYGVASASLQYFGKPLGELTVSEAAFLAALPKAPNNYNPLAVPEKAKDRRNYVLARMRADGYITRERYEEAVHAELNVFPRKIGSTYPEAKYFVEEVRREIYNVFGEKMLYEGGLSVRTSLDTDYQLVAQRALRDGLQAYDRTQGYAGPVAQLDLSAATPWQEALKTVQPLADVPEWMLAVVLNVTDERAELGLQTGERGHIPLPDLAWARLRDKDGHLGPEVKRVSDVLARGDVVYVTPVLVEGAKQLNQSKRPEPNQIQYWTLRQVPSVNGALVAMDPHTGRVLALTGGFSYAQSEFDRAVQAVRQPGSSFKPFVYASALDFDGGMRFTPSSLVLDAPFVLDQGPGLGFWKPENYEDEFTFGPSTLRRAIEKSRNVVTIRLAQEIGMETVVDYAYRFGIIKAVPDFKPLSMAIGAMETTLLRLITAYSILDNGGKKIEPTLIDRVQDRFGKTLYRHDERECMACAVDRWDGQGEPVLPDRREQVVDPRTAFQMVNIMTGVVQRGTGAVIASVGKPLAGKTGTTNEEKDAWFLGFSPDLAVGVFIGYDTPKPMGKNGTGGKIAAPIFRDFMQAVIGDKPAVPFRTPPGVTMVRVNLETGQPSMGDDGRTVMEAFKAGTEPSGEEGPVLQGGPLTLEDLQPESDISGVPQPQGDSIGSGTGGLY